MIGVIDGEVSDASVNFHFDAMRSFQSKEGKIKCRKIGGSFVKESNIGALQP